MKKICADTVVFGCNSTDRCKQPLVVQRCSISARLAAYLSRCWSFRAIAPWATGNLGPFSFPFQHSARGKKLRKKNYRDLNPLLYRDRDATAERGCRRLAGHPVDLILLLGTLRQTLQGSFLAVSKPNFARKYAFESSRRDLHNALLGTALKSHFFFKKF